MENVLLPQLRSSHFVVIALLSCCLLAIENGLEQGLDNQLMCCQQCLAKTVFFGQKGDIAVKTLATLVGEKMKREEMEGGTEDEDTQRLLSRCHQHPLPSFSHLPGIGVFKNILKTNILNEDRGIFTSSQDKIKTLCH